MRISDWSSDVCSSDLDLPHEGGIGGDVVEAGNVEPIALAGAKAAIPQRDADRFGAFRREGLDQAPAMPIRLVDEQGDPSWSRHGRTTCRAARRSACRR